MTVKCLKNELQRDSKVISTTTPWESLEAAAPYRRGDEGIFEESLIEERRQGLQFINKAAGHLAPSERCLHMFLQEEATDRNCPGKVRQ